MARWHRRKIKDAQALEALRAHVDTAWAIANTLTGDDATAVAGDDATAVAVLNEVVRGTLLQRRRYSEPGLRLEIVIAATEAATTRTFSPLFRRSHAVPLNAGPLNAAPLNAAPLNAGPLNGRASALRRAFSRRLSWDVQALLWATEVEGISVSDVERRLGQVHPGKEAARVTLRLAYVDLRTDLDEGCRATLRTVFGSSAGPENLAEDNAHLKSCALCQAEMRWLTNLRSALGMLPSAMPAIVWEETRRFVLGDDRARSYDSLGHDVAPQSDTVTQSDNVTQPEPSSPEGSPGRADVVLPAAESANPTAGEASPATNGHGHTHVRRVVEPQKAGDHVL